MPHAPTAFHQFNRQPIEQFRIGRRRSFPAKVEHGRDEWGSEMASPNMVDRNASGKWITPIGDPFGKRCPAACALRRKLYSWIVRGAAQETRRSPLRAGERSEIVLGFDFGLRS